jgi:hypothetical protein
MSKRKHTALLPLDLEALSRATGLNLVYSTPNTDGLVCLLADGRSVGFAELFHCFIQRKLGKAV